MPQDPHPPGGEPEFDWLYGADGAPRAPHEHGAPAHGFDETRMMPAVPGGPSDPSDRTGPSGPSRPRRRTKIRWGRIILVLAVLWLTFLIAVPLMGWSGIQRVNATPGGSRPAAGGGTNYLLVGSDSRQGLTQDQQHKLGVDGVAVEHGRTDTIMILHTGSGPTTIVSIPRDSLVKIPGRGTDKINSAFYFGDAPLLIQTIEQDTGLHIDHFVEVGLGSFVQAVDAVGGVKICPDAALVDPLANLNVKPGCQQADGATALAWARSRHAFALGDVAREQHQREIVHEVGAKAFSPWTFLLPWRYMSLSSAASSTLKVDKDMSMWAMADFANALSSSGSGKTCAMPISDLAVHWDKTRAPALIHYLQTDTTANIPANLCTASGLPQ